MSSFVNLQKRVDNIHRLLGFIPEAFKKWPHPSVQPAFRYDQLCISKCSGERIRRTSLDGLCILCMVWVGQPVGKRINIFAKEKLRGGIKGESCHQVLKTRQDCRETNTKK